MITARIGRRVDMITRDERRERAYLDYSRGLITFAELKQKLKGLAYEEAEKF